jgi:hypothetical protein
MGIFFASLAASLLPKQFRYRLPFVYSLDLRKGAIVSGLLEGLVSLTVVIVRYLIFLPQKVGEMGGRVIERGAETALISEAVHYGMGYVALVEYLFHPLTILLIYFTVEGVARLLAALVTEEIVGTLPLYFIAWAVERFGRARAERALGPRVRDIVEPVYSPDYDLRIFTCRPKRDWDRMITVSHEGQFYEVVGEQAGKPPHRFIYRLRKSKPGRVIRAVDAYDPDEVLVVEKPSSGVLTQAVAWLGRRLGMRVVEQGAPPPISDIVERLTNGDFELRISSCRSKPTWNHLMTVEYEDEFYEVAGEAPGTTPHPYVYLLRRLPQGKAIRTLHHYSPDESLREP